MASIRTGIIGLGYWGPNLLRNFSAESDCEMVLCCDRDSARIEKMQKLYPHLKFTTNVDDLLKDPTIELVLIATPTSSHFPLAKSALMAGKHVFIEKPMTQTLAEADELLELAKKMDRQIFVDHTFVFSPAVSELSRMATDGSLGTLLYYDSTRINLGLIQKDINVLWDLAIHDLSILSTFVNLNDVTSVSAHGNAFFGKQEEVGHLHLHFKQNFGAHIHVSWLSPVKLRTAILAGSKAMATFDDTEPSEKIRLYDHGVEHDKTKADPFFPIYRAGNIVIPALPSKETLAVEARHVMQCIQGKEQPKASGMHGRSIVAILEAANRSLQEKGTVSLDLQ